MTLILQLQLIVALTVHSGEVQNSNIPSDDSAGYDFGSDIPPVSSSDDDEPTISLQDDLAGWVVQSQITRDACNSLLLLLRKHDCQLPKDRTVLKTPRSFNVESKCGGQFVYFGLHKILQQAVQNFTTVFPLQMQVNVDDVPLYKS